jgi:adenylosuccinate synthase
MAQHTIVAGLQFGDEGKGKIVDALVDSGNYNIVARVQGGGNAGHTIVKEDKKFAFHHVPSGILSPEITCVMGNGEIFDLINLPEEIRDIQDKGVIVGPGNLKISNKSHVVMPYHKILDIAIDMVEKVGTTAKGMGPAYSQKYARTGIRSKWLKDMRALQIFHDKVEGLETLIKSHVNKEQKYEFFKKIDKHNLTEYIDSNLKLNKEKIENEIIENGNFLTPYITNTEIFLNNSDNENKRMLFECAQGFFLDIDFGTYPYVTSSNSSTSGVYTGTGMVLRDFNVVGILKAYTTRVGEGPLPTEQKNEVGKHLVEKGHEYGTTTGRERRCGWLDNYQAAYSTMINSVDEIVLTKLDVLTGLDPIKICGGYMIGMNEVKDYEFDAETLEKCKPIYDYHKGWNEDISKINRYDDLPEPCKDYIENIEQYLKLPVTMVSVGPDRNQTIFIE